jgi:hypothetical protein
MVFDPLSLRIISLGLILECAPGLPNLSQKSPPKQARSTTPIVAATGVRNFGVGIRMFSELRAFKTASECAQRFYPSARGTGETVYQCAAGRAANTV